MPGRKESYLFLFFPSRIVVLQCWSFKYIQVVLYFKYSSPGINNTLFKYYSSISIWMIIPSSIQYFKYTSRPAFSRVGQAQGRGYLLLYTLSIYFPIV
jgi:hypothetical protein